MATITGQSGATSGQYTVANPGNYRDVYGFENAPDNTNLPQIYEREVTIFGNRTLMGFLRMIGAEMPTNSRQIRWAEQRRLHIIYTDVRRDSTDTNEFAVYTNGTQTDASAASGTALTDHSLRVGDKVLVTESVADSSVADNDASVLAVVTAKGTDGTVTLSSFLGGGDSATANDGFDEIGGGADNKNITVLVVGSEFDKGTQGRTETIQPNYDSYINNTIIMKETFTVNGSDANQIGWVEIADENGVQGKYWYVKGKSEAMTRFEDYTETALLEDRRATDVSTGANDAPAVAAGYKGSEGLFQAVTDRGLTVTGGLQTSNSTFLADLDMFVRAWDKEGNIEENVWYLNRDESLNFDNGMAAQNNGGQATNTSWGLFNNKMDMALNLGFTGVRRGSYDIYKKDWKYLNQVDGRGSFRDIKGISVPMGSKSVYNEYGQNLQSPFATINYLAGAHSNRKMQTWVHGGQAPNHSDDSDSFSIQWLTERCICVKGANNFAIFK